MAILTEKFRFITDNVFLCPWIDTDTGKQKLILQKINSVSGKVEFEDGIDCIHTAITDISTTDLKNYQNDVNVQEHILTKTLEIRSSERLTEINLTPEEKFNALKSWTAGIAEAGMNAFLIQGEIDKNLDLLYPITHFLMRFMVKVERDFLPEFIAKIERECMFEGIRHESSFIANTIPILEMVWVNYLKKNMIQSEDIEIIKMVAALDKTCKLFKTNTNFLILLMLAEPDYAKSVIIPEESEKTYKKLVELKFIDSIFKDPVETKRVKIKSLAAATLKNQWECADYTILNDTSFCEEAENQIKSIIPDLFKSVFRCKICICPKILCGRDHSLNMTVFNEYWDGKNFPKIADIKNKPETKLMVESLHMLHETGELNKDIMNRIRDVLYKVQREIRKNEIKRLAYDFLRDYWENDEWIIDSHTDFCRNADSLYEFTIPEYFMDVEDYNINLCPNILCDNDICPVNGYGVNETLSFFIYDKYGQEDEDENWIPIKIADVKEKPEVKLIVEALRMLYDTGEFSTDIIRRINEIIYQW